MYNLFIFLVYEDIGETVANSESSTYSYAAHDTMWREINLSLYSIDKKCVSKYTHRPCAPAL